MMNIGNVLPGGNNVIQQMLGQSLGKLFKESVESNFVETIKCVIDVDTINDNDYDNNIYTTEDFYSLFMVKLIFNKKYKFINRIYDKNKDKMCLTSPNNGMYTVMLDRSNAAILLVSTNVRDNSVRDNEKSISIYIVGSDCHKWIVYFKKKRSILWEKFNPSKGRVWIRPMMMRYSTINAKNIENIILEESKKKSIIDTIDKFLSNKDFYKENGIPHKLGILLEGPPGTGKSSIIHSIALKYNRNITILSSENIYEHMTRNSFSQSVLSRDILLIEEIDSLMSNDPLTVESEDKKSSKTGVLRREQILKFIDSLPNNTILIATTNFYEKLDAAMIRPGRFDLKVRMDYFDKQQTLEMIKSYNMDESFADKYTDEDYPICPAQLQADIISAKCEAFYKEG